VALLAREPSNQTALLQAGVVALLSHWNALCITTLVVSSSPEGLHVLCDAPMPLRVCDRAAAFGCVAPTVRSALKPDAYELELMAFPDTIATVHEHVRSCARCVH
jgi:hypothetical protein